MAALKVAVEAEDRKQGLTLGELSSLVSEAVRMNIDVEAHVSGDFTMSGKVKKLVIG